MEDGGGNGDQNRLESNWLDSVSRGSCHAAPVFGEGRDYDRPFDPAVPRETSFKSATVVEIVTSFVHDNSKESDKNYATIGLTNMYDTYGLY